MFNFTQADKKKNIDGPGETDESSAGINIFAPHKQKYNKLD